MTTQDITLASVASAFITNAQNFVAFVSPQALAPNPTGGTFLSYDAALGRMAWANVSLTLQQVLTIGNTASALTLNINNSFVSPTITTTIASTKINSPTLSTEGAVSTPNNIFLTGAASGGTPSITVAGSDTNISLNLSPKGAGSVNINAPNGNGITAVSNTTASAIISTVGSATNIDLRLAAKGTGNVTLGNATNASLQVTGNLSSYLELAAIGSATDIDIVLTPKGAGSFYPVGNSLSTAQPRIALPNALGSSTLTFGAQGTVLTSGGPNNAPYWGNPTDSYQYIYTSILTLSTTIPSTSLGGGSYVPTASVNNLNLTISALGAITGFVANKTYRIELTYQVAQSAGNNYFSYCSCATSNQAITTANSWDSGIATNCYRYSVGAVSDYWTGSGVGFYVVPPTGTGTLFCWRYLSPSGQGNVPFKVTIIITKLN
jgi:hypothetical protein